MSEVGEVTYVFNMKAPNQMLVELKDIEIAKHIVESYKRTGPPLMNGARVYFQYSKSQEINRDISLTKGIDTLF